MNSESTCRAGLVPANIVNRAGSLRVGKGEDQDASSSVPGAEVTGPVTIHHRGHSEHGVLDNSIAALSLTSVLPATSVVFLR